MNQEKTYECRNCKKLTTGFPTVLRNKCLLCRNMELRQNYEQTRLKTLKKKELIIEHKKLLAKIKSTGEENEEILDDDISLSDNDKDEDYVPPTPVQPTWKKNFHSYQLKNHPQRKQKT